MRSIITESAFLKLFEAKLLSDIYKEYYSDIDENIFKQIISSDPTWNSQKPDKMGKFSKWLLTLYRLKRIKLEDLYKAHEYLSYFVKYNNLLPNKDINTYKSLSDLYTVIKQYIDNPNQPKSKSDEIRNIKKGAEKVYEDNQWLIIIPHTKEASCYYGKGTQWCTAADKGNNMFDSYNKQGPLFININKKTNEKYQFHFETDSFMDETDTPIESPIYETIGLNENVVNWYKENVNEWQKICIISKTILYTDGNEVKLVKMPENDYWELVDDNSWGSIASNIILGNNTDTSIYGDMLRDDKYAKFKNTYGFYTLVSYNTYNNNVYLIGTDYTYISEIENGYDYDLQHTILETINKYGTYEILLLPNNFDIYRKKDYSSIVKAVSLYYNIIGIYKKNGLVDLINYDGYEINDIKLIDNQLKFDDDYEYAYALDKFNNKIRINLETLEEEE